MIQVGLDHRPILRAFKRTTFAAVWKDYAAIAPPSSCRSRRMARNRVKSQGRAAIRYSARA